MFVCESLYEYVYISIHFMWLMQYGFVDVRKPETISTWILCTLYNVHTQRATDILKTEMSPYYSITDDLLALLTCRIIRFYWQSNTIANMEILRLCRCLWWMNIHTVTHTPHKPKVTQWTEKDANAISKKRRSRKKNSFENTRTENDLIQANRTQQQRQNGLDSTRLVIFILVVL